jgi:hypothetical protein
LFDVIDERWKKGAVFNLRRAFSAIKMPFYRRMRRMARANRTTLLSPIPKAEDARAGEIIDDCISIIFFQVCIEKSKRGALWT